MPRKAQIHKPLFINPLGCFFQQFDLFLVVFNQIVVSRENICDTMLYFYTGHPAFMVLTILPDSNFEYLRLLPFLKPLF